MSYSIVGSAKPVWLRAVMVREGDDVVTRCCVVADGQFFPIEVRVNVPQLIASAKALGLDKSSVTTVGGFGSWLKKAVKSVTKNKIVKAVGSVVKKVAKNPIVQVMNPALAITAHTSSKALGGKGVIKGAAGKIVNMGTAVVTKVVPLPSPMSFVNPRAAAALGVGMRAVTTAKAGGAIAAVARTAQQQVNIGKNAAAAINSKVKLQNPAAAKAAVQRAVNLQNNIKKAAPALAKKVVQSAKVKAQLNVIAQKAKAGSADAKLAANVIARSAQALDQIARLQASAAGGLPGLLITARGQIVRAPKGRFQLKASSVKNPDVLYRGAKEATLKGSFSAVSGTTGWHPSFQMVDEHGQWVSGWRELIGNTPSWGGHDDPGQEIDGPLGRLHHPSGDIHLFGALTP